MKPTPQDWAALKAVFDVAVDLPRAERDSVIAAAALSPDRLAELRSLLANHDAATGGQGFLADNAATRLAEPPSRVGQRLGAWCIVRPIGAGGMGEVFEVRRADGQFEGRAAVKLLKRGMDSAAVLQRFARERHALARLSHPHIARLLDAGASAEGLPFFVLEHVDGRPIDQAVVGWPLARRLRLFLQLTDAVAHAHRNLLVHRDLKPGNVLVDREGQVKLLDFGIAKALDPLDGTDGLTTLAGPRPYTPHYASPEQVRGEPVSTGTDVYSLGVLLYQLLTGTRPTGRQAVTPAEAARSVLEEAPMRPSRLSATEAVDPQWLHTRSQLAGDLDNILLKALEKDPARRYASVDALAADLRAHLGGFPVGARVASPLHVLLRGLQRHAVAAVAAGLGAIGLVFGLATALARGHWQGALGALGAGAAAAGLVLALVQARRAALAREAAEGHAQTLRQLGREVVVAYGDLVTFLPRGMERKAELLTTLARYLEQLLLQAPGDATLQAELGVVCARLAHLHSEGEFAARAEPAAVQRHGHRARVLFAAAESQGQAGPAAMAWWALVLGDLARLAQDRRELGEAGERLDEADAVLQRGLDRAPGHGDLLRAQPAIGMLRVQWLTGWDRPNQQRPDAGLDMLDRVEDQYRAALNRAAARGGHPDPDDLFQLGTVEGTRALILVRQQRLPAAAAAARRAVDWREQAWRQAPHNRVMAGGLAADRNLLAGLCIDLGDAAGALAASAPGWTALDRLMAEDPGNQSWPTQRRWLAFHHGRALLAAGQAAEALAVLQHSEDWLAPLVVQADVAPRLRCRWARTRCAMALARQAMGAPLPGPVAEAAARLQTHLDGHPDDADARAAWAECQALLTPG